VSDDPLSPLEAAVGMPLGGGPPVALPRTPGLDPRAALEEATLPALRAGPCWIAFSGGRDSSLLLAAAAAMARRAGLEPPIALTFRFPALADTKEDGWQERVIAHLRHERWVRVELGDELDLLGEHGVRALRALGPYWPANAHFALALARHAASGTVLTGEGGDDLFAWWRWQRAATVLGSGVPRAWRDVPTLALALAPRPLRRAHERRGVERLPWLTDRAAAAHRRALGRLADVPWRWDRQLAWMRGRDDVTVSLRTTEQMCAIAGVSFAAPLLDLRFLGALAAAGGAGGLGGRRLTLTSLFGALLPEDVLARADKARFNAAFIGPGSRAFASSWTGAGVDATLVDAAALQRAWLAAHVDWRSADLLQRAWLSESQT
jgi:asparagine synthase (glutamine-hydrolysing)